MGSYVLMGACVLMGAYVLHACVLKCSPLICQGIKDFYISNRYPLNTPSILQYLLFC